jgi:hypothetical protein
MSCDKFPNNPNRCNNNIDSININTNLNEQVNNIDTIENNDNNIVKNDKNNIFTITCSNNNGNNNYNSSGVAFLAYLFDIPLLFTCNHVIKECKAETIKINNTELNIELTTKYSYIINRGNYLSYYDIVVFKIKNEIETLNKFNHTDIEIYNNAIIGDNVELCAIKDTINCNVQEINFTFAEILLSNNNNYFYPSIGFKNAIIYNGISGSPVYKNNKIIGITFAGNMGTEFGYFIPFNKEITSIIYNNIIDDWRRN